MNSIQLRSNEIHNNNRVYRVRRVQTTISIRLGYLCEAVNITGHLYSWSCTKRRGGRGGGGGAGDRTRGRDRRW